MSASKRRIFPNLARNEHKTTLLIHHPLFSVHFRIIGRLTTQQRYQVGITLCRLCKENFPDIHNGYIFHDDGAFNAMRIWNRDVNPNRGPDLYSRSGKLGYVVKMRRLALGMTQEELAALCGLCRTHLSKIERGFVTPHCSTISVLEHRLGASLPHFRDDVQSFPAVDDNGTETPHPEPKSDISKGSRTCAGTAGAPITATPEAASTESSNDMTAFGIGIQPRSKDSLRCNEFLLTPVHATPNHSRCGHAATHASRGSAAPAPNSKACLSTPAPSQAQSAPRRTDQ